MENQPLTLYDSFLHHPCPCAVNCNMNVIQAVALSRCTYDNKSNGSRESILPHCRQNRISTFSMNVTMTKLESCYKTMGY